MAQPVEYWVPCHGELLPSRAVLFRTPAGGPREIYDTLSAGFYGSKKIPMHLIPAAIRKSSIAAGVTFPNEKTTFFLWAEVVLVPPPY